MTDSNKTLNHTPKNSPSTTAVFVLLICSNPNGLVTTDAAALEKLSKKRERKLHKTSFYSQNIVHDPLAEHIKK